MRCKLSCPALSCPGLAGVKHSRGRVRRVRAACPSQVRTIGVAVLFESYKIDGGQCPASGCPEAGKKASGEQGVLTPL